MGRETKRDLLWIESYLLEYGHNEALQMDGKKPVKVLLNIPNNAENSRKINGTSVVTMVPPLFTTIFS